MAGMVELLSTRAWTQARNRSLRKGNRAATPASQAVRLRRCAAVARLDLGAGCWLRDAGLEGAGR
jgi:hypothetical protein